MVGRKLSVHQPRFGFLFKHISSSLSLQSFQRPVLCLTYRQRPVLGNLQSLYRHGLMDCYPGTISYCYYLHFQVRKTEA